MVETGYRQLIVMRHAKTEHSDGSDRARELTSRGRADARAAGRWLHDNGLEPDLVLTSPAVRARTTAEIVSGELGSDPRTRVEDELYGADAAEVVDLIAAAAEDASTVLVIGHNPTMEELAHSLQRDPAQEWPALLPTSGVAALRVPVAWADLADGSADLTAFHVPRA